MLLNNLLNRIPSALLVSPLFFFQTTNFISTFCSLAENRALKMQFKDKVEAIKEQFFMKFHWKRLRIQHEDSLLLTDILICFPFTTFEIFPHQTHGHQNKSIVYVNISSLINYFFPPSRQFSFLLDWLPLLWRQKWFSSFVFREKFFVRKTSCFEFYWKFAWKISSESIRNL